jgi:hypothetical protein
MAEMEEYIESLARGYFEGDIYLACVDNKIGNS